MSGNAYAGLFSKNEFKFERCYTDSYTNHSDWIENGVFLRWEWEINLKNNNIRAGCKITNITILANS